MYPRTIAVDFDGTLCESAYPNIGKPKTLIIEYVKRRKAEGYTIILWTCRTGQYLTNAVEWCKQQGLTFDYINENNPAKIALYGDDTRKISADEYIDDRATNLKVIEITEAFRTASETLGNMAKSITAKETAINIYAEVSAIISNYTTVDAYGSVPHITADGLEGLLADLDALFEENFGVTVNRKNIETMTWQEIADIAKSGNAAKHFKVGDKKEFELITGEKLTAVVLGFDHDKLANGKRGDVAGITFGIEGILDGRYEMNEDDTNEGGWKKCKMRNTYMPRIEKLLPAELRNVLCEVEKSTGVGGGYVGTEKTVDKLFLFSLVEVTGETEYTAKGEDKQYKYFKDADKLVKRRGDSASYWWLRSPSVSYSSVFRYVNSSGGVNNGGAYASCGVSFGFCL